VNDRRSDLVNDVDFEWLEKVVRDAGEISLRHFRRVTAVRKVDNTVVTVADREVEAFLREALSQAFPADSLLGEEMETHVGRSRRVWAIDPIDGTAAYATGLPVWGVSVGILHDWEPVAGIFYMPLLDEVYLSHGHDALFNGRPINADESGHVDDESFLCVPSDTHRKFHIDFIGKTRALGSTAANMCYVARGTAVAALLGHSSLWDIAGTLPLLRAAGGDLRGLSGRPLDLAAVADGRKFPEPLLAGASWALDYFAQRIEVVPRGDV
jgi:myo-inositol-1(or 4)-monophosphatase